MSADKSLIVCTGDDPRGGYRLVVMQKAGGWPALSDLEGTWHAHTLSAGDAVEKSYALRYRRPSGKVDRYQAKYRVRIRQKDFGERRRPGSGGKGTQKLSRDKFESDEDATAELSVYYTGKTANGRFDRVVIRRRNTKREVLEVAPNGTVKHNKRPGPPYQPLVTPNFEAEPTARGQYYIAMDDLGRIARREETPYHYVWYDSLCYMFPIFPKDEIKLGQRWQYEMPVIVGRQYSANEMNLKVAFTFTDLRSVRSGKRDVFYAVIKYDYYGSLDTRHPGYGKRLPPKAPNVHWRRFAVEGEGKAYFDVEAGKVAWKRESYRIHVERGYDRQVTRSENKLRLRARREKRPPPEIERMHYSATNTIEFSSRLLAPGERADERPSRRD